MKIRLVTILLLLINVGVKCVEAQSYNMSNTPVTVSCGSTVYFYDSGGPNGNYSNSQNLTQTFTSSDPSKCLQVTFTSFSLESNSSCSWDYLIVYGGASTSSTNLGKFCGSNSPGTITSSTGSITFVFRSDGSLNYSGWAATISCVDCGGGSGGGGGGTGGGGLTSDCTSSDQGSPCFPGNIHPFCTDENPYGITYQPGTTGNANQFLGDSHVGCLYSTPAPAWYFMQISQSGNLVFNISATLDVDFACWGPFQASTQQDFVNKLCCGYYQLHTNYHDSNTSSSANYPYGNLIDCSYSAAHTETCHINNAQVGEWYLLLLTNYSQVNGSISFSASSSSTATTNCDLLAPFTYNNPLCEGDDLILTCSSPVTGATYHWFGPGGWTATTTTPTVSRPNALTSFAGEYSLYLTGNNINSQTSHITVEVGAMPTVLLTASSDTICRGSSVTLTASGASSYAWTPAGSTAAQRTFTPAETTVYRVVGANNSCRDTVFYTIVVNPKPTVTVSTNPANANICQGDTAILYATGGANYEWRIGNATTVIGEEDTLRVSPESNTSYRVIVTSDQGCTNSATKTIVVRNLPTVSISGASQMCLGDSVLLTSTTATTYLWNTGQTTRTIYAKPSIDSIYSVSVTNTYGCMAVATKELHVNMPDTTHYDAEVCLGNAYIDDNFQLPTQEEVGIFNYNTMYSNQQGCDSLVVMSLQVNFVHSNLFEDSSCISFAWYDSTYTQSGTYLHSFVNASGCWQTDTLVLTIFNPVHQHQTVVACESFTWVDGNTYTQSGTYLYAHQDSHGCNQVDTLHLTVHHAVNTVERVMVCEPYTWRGQTYDVSGIYTDMHNDEHQCIQVDTLQLTVTTKPAFVSMLVTDATCNEANGKVEVDVNGGIEPYQYFFQPSGQVAQFTGLNVGHYNLQVLDSLGCSDDSSFDIHNIVHSVNLVSTTPEHCDREDGSVEVAVSGGFGPFTYHWQGAGTTEEGHLDQLRQGSYTVEVTDDADGCVISLLFTIEEIEGIRPCYYFATVNELEMGVVNCTEDVNQWHWTFGDGGESDEWQPVYMYSSPGQYDVELTIIDEHQCEASLRQRYVIYDVPTCYIPTAFFPGSDYEENRTFGPVGQSFSEDEYEMRIYDRWGVLVFYSRQLLQRWDGTQNGAELPAGDYIYHIIYRDVNSGWHTVKGKVTLLR